MKSVFSEKKKMIEETPKNQTAPSSAEKNKNESQKPSESKSTKKSVKKGSEKTIFDSSKTYKQLRTGRNPESQMRMKFLNKIAELSRSQFPNLSWVYSNEMYQIAEKQVIRMYLFST